MKQIIITMLMIGKLFATGTIMIEVAYEGQDYNITRAWKVKETFPPTVKEIVESKDDIVIELKDKNGTVVEKFRIKNPRIIRGTLSETGNEEGHDDFKKQKGSFILRYPYAEGLKYLNIINANKKNIQYTPALKNKIKTTGDMEFGSLLK